MKKIIIVDQIQFGYYTDDYHYCKYLKDIYDIVFMCWEHKMPKIEMSGIRVIYVERKGNFLIRSLRFLRCLLKEINRDSSIVIIKYFKVLSMTLRLLKPSQCFVLDIRTASIKKKFIKRRLNDWLLIFETAFFKNVTIISKNLAEKLRISHKAHILPLGSEVISSNKKLFNVLNLIYVGTLENRNIEVTLYGFKKFYDEYKNKIKLSFIIIGDGPKNEKENLENIVDYLGLKGIVTTTGRIPHTKLYSYFFSSNIGISYIPMTDYYDVQPPTKTFEYLLSGMPVIATSTSENKKLINSKNGVLIGEKPLDFYFGLKNIFDNLYIYDSDVIRNGVLQYTWENIVSKNLKLYLQSI